MKINQYIEQSLIFNESEESQVYKLCSQAKAFNLNFISTNLVWIKSVVEQFINTKTKVLCNIEYDELNDKETLSNILYAKSIGAEFINFKVSLKQIVDESLDFKLFQIAAQSMGMYLTIIYDVKLKTKAEYINTMLKNTNYGIFIEFNDKIDFEFLKLINTNKVKLIADGESDENILKALRKKIIVSTTDFLKLNGRLNEK